MKKSLIVVGLIGLGAVVSFGSWVNDYFDLNSIPHQSIKLHLGFMGASIYEYHSMTGRWPARREDLATTSLPLKSPHWKQMLELGSDVIVFRGDLKPEPKDNAGVILTYHPKGLFAELGRTWVCWGDLRLEFIKTEELRRRLGALK
jgi:hypothetical protein